MSTTAAFNATFTTGFDAASAFNAFTGFFNSSDS
jgi:hypothetical protein